MDRSCNSRLSVVITVWCRRLRPSRGFWCRGRVSSTQEPLTQGKGWTFRTSHSCLFLAFLGKVALKEFAGNSSSTEHLRILCSFPFPQKAGRTRRRIPQEERSYLNERQSSRGGRCVLWAPRVV